MIKIQGNPSYEFKNNQPYIIIKINRLQNMDKQNPSGPIYIRVRDSLSNKQIAYCQMDPLQANYGYAPLEKKLRFTATVHRGARIGFAIYEKYKNSGWKLSDTKVFDEVLKYDHQCVQNRLNKNNFRIRKVQNNQDDHSLRNGIFDIIGGGLNFLAQISLRLNGQKNIIKTDFWKLTYLLLLILIMRPEQFNIWGYHGKLYQNVSQFCQNSFNINQLLSRNQIFQERMLMHFFKLTFLFQLITNQLTLRFWQLFKHNSKFHNFFISLRRFHLQLSYKIIKCINKRQESSNIVISKRSFRGKLSLLSNYVSIIKIKYIFNSYLIKIFKLIVQYGDDSRRRTSKTLEIQTAFQYSRRIIYSQNCQYRNEKQRYII